MKQISSILLFSLTWICYVQSFAQDSQKLQLPGDITTSQTTTILQAAENLAKSQGILINIAIVDAGANLKGFIRMDGSYLGSIDVAIGKAKTARLFNCATGDLGKISQPGGDIYNIEFSNQGLITFPGGIPIKDKEGVIIGAIGISGGTIEQDHDIATQAAESIL